MKEKIQCCPLCGSNDYKDVRAIDLNELMETWITKRGFNPIDDCYKNELLKKRVCTNCGLYYYNYHLPDFEELYKNLEKVPGYYPTFRPTYEIARNIIEEIKPQSILEIGSGNGCFMEYISGYAEVIVGNEYNTKAVELCKSKGLNVISTPIENIDNEFDCICHHEVLEHVFDTKSFISNSIKILKKGGKLIIGTPDPESILKINGISEFHYPPHHQFDFSYKTFEWLAKEYNLNIYDYKKTTVDQRQYDKYIFLTNDTISFDECNKKFTGHSHVIVFEKM